MKKIEYFQTIRKRDFAEILEDSPTTGHLVFYKDPFRLLLLFFKIYFIFLNKSQFYCDVFMYCFCYSLLLFFFIEFNLLVVVFLSNHNYL